MIKRAEKGNDDLRVNYSFLLVKERKVHYEYDMVAAEESAIQCLTPKMDYAPYCGDI